ncbi:MAG: folate-binding protein YgfZ [Gaiellaceae bacterium]
MDSVTGWAPRPRDFVAVSGPDAEDFLQRMLSNDVAALERGGAQDALLLTPKARVIAPVRVLRRAADDFLLLTEPGLGETLRGQLLRARFAAKVDVRPEEHRSFVVLGGRSGMEIADYPAPARELLDAEPAGERLADEVLERLRIEARTPAWGRELDDRVLPAEAGLVDRAVSLTKGCYPGQEPIARLHYRGHANRGLRVLEIEGDDPPGYDAEVRAGDRTVGRVTSAVLTNDGVVALGYVRTEVPQDALLSVEGHPARLA